MNDPRTAAELEGEEEVDLSSAWARIRERWWLPVGGLLVGALIGLALALSGGTTWRAETIVYLGQPFAPLGGGQIQSLATNPVTISEVVRSESVVQKVSDATGIPAAKLRSSISTKELTAEGQLRGINPLMEIAVKGTGGRARVEEAADALAEEVVGRVSIYVQDKVELLKEQSASSAAQLAAVNERIASAQEQQKAIIADTSLPLEQRLLVTANLNSVITTADARRAELQDALFESRQLLNLAESVESSRVVTEAAASKTSARSRRTSLVVGAFIGGLLGTLVALVAGSLATRRRPSEATT
jgi:hypothetical protein